MRSRSFFALAVILSSLTLSSCSAPLESTPTPALLSAQAWSTQNTSIFTTPERDASAALWPAANGTVYLVSEVQINSGNTDLTLMRYLSSGTLDLSFGVSGSRSINRGGLERVRKVIQGTDGSVYLFGTRSQSGNPNDVLTILKFSASGTFLAEAQPSLDFAFNLSDVALTQGGKFVLIGKTLPIWGASQFAMLRLNTTLTLDSTFGSAGSVLGGFAGAAQGGTALTLDASGRIVVIGTVSSTSSAWRYSANGSLDMSFNGNRGRIHSSDQAGLHSFVYTDVVQDAGAIYVSGFSLDPNFASKPFVAYFSPGGEALGGIQNTVPGFPGNLSVLPGGQGTETTSALVLRSGGLTVVGSGSSATGVPGTLSYALSLSGGFSSASRQITTFGAQSSGARDAVLAADGSVHVLADRVLGSGQDPAVLRRP